MGAPALGNEQLSDYFDRDQAGEVVSRCTSRHLAEGRERRLLGPILIKLYGLVRSESIRRLIRKFVLSLESGPLFSVTIRKIFEKYHNRQIGLYSGGGALLMELFLNKPPGIKIGRFCSIASTVRIFNANHPIDRRSSHAFFYNPELGLVKKDLASRNQIEIGHDVWIGHNAVILAGVEKIGTGAVIGAGAIVNKNVPPYAIVMGYPARFIGYRFSQEKIDGLLKSAWWEKPIQELISGFDRFTTALEGESGNP